MTRSVFKILTITLLAGSLGQVALSAPAYAGGRISFNLVPDNAEDADLFSTGLRVYSLYRGLKDADIRQLGRGTRLALPRPAEAISASSSSRAMVIPQPCGRTATTMPMAFSSTDEILKPMWSRMGIMAVALPSATAGRQFTAIPKAIPGKRSSLILAERESAGERRAE